MAQVWLGGFGAGAVVDSGSRTLAMRLRPAAGRAPARSRGCGSRGNSLRRRNGFSRVPTSLSLSILVPALWQVRLRPAAGRAPARSRGCVSRGNSLRRRNGLSRVPASLSLSILVPALWQVRLRPAAGRAPARSRGCVSRGNSLRRRNGLSRVPRRFRCRLLVPALWQVRLRPAAGSAARRRGCVSRGNPPPPHTVFRASRVTSVVDRFPHFGKCGYGRRPGGRQPVAAAALSRGNSRRRHRAGFAPQFRVTSGDSARRLEVPPVHFGCYPSCVPKGSEPHQGVQLGAPAVMCGELQSR